MAMREGFDGSLEGVECEPIADAAPMDAVIFSGSSRYSCSRAARAPAACSCTACIASIAGRSEDASGSCGVAAAGGMVKYGVLALTDGVIT